MPTLRLAPESRVAKIPGLPSVGIFLTIWNPASRSRPMVKSQLSSIRHFSAAIPGCRIQSCRLEMVSALLASRALRMATASALGVAAAATPGSSRLAPVAAADASKARRSN